MKVNQVILHIVLMIACITGSSLAETQWPDWRGPGGQGISNAVGLPLSWSETQNVVWKTPIHDHGHSTPVVWGNQVWLTTATQDGTTLYAVCLDVDTGKIIHDKAVFQNDTPQRIHSNNTYATPSAVVEEGRVYVHFGTFGTAALDTQTGEILWKRTDLNCEHMQGPASSPILYNDLLILHLEGTDVQFITAVNKKTGEDVWRYDRPKEYYATIKEPVYRKSYQTPILVEVEGQTQLISNGALMVTGHEPLTGKELWQVRYGYDNSIARVVSGQGLFFVNCGGPPNHAELWAVRQGGKGNVTDTHVAWKMTRNVPLESSPVLVQDKLYTVSDNGVLLCTQAKTGEIIWQENLRDRFGASPLLAENRIYLNSKKGKTTVIQPGQTFQLLSENQLDGEIWASPAVAGNSLILRTKTHVYRIQNQ